MNAMKTMLCVMTLAGAAAAQAGEDAAPTKPRVVLPEPMPFEVGLEVGQDEVCTAKVHSNDAFLGVLVASLDAKTMQFPGLPPILGDLVVIGCGFNAPEHKFTVGRIPEGWVVYLQGLGMSQASEIAASGIAKAAAR